MSQFVIIGDDHELVQRTKDYLCAFPEICCHGMIFCRTDQNKIQFANGNHIPLYVGQDPIDYLDRIIFKSHNHPILHVGFCLFYDQAKDASWSRVWNYCRQLKVFHCKRNPIDTFLSRYDDDDSVDLEAMSFFIDRWKIRHEEWDHAYRNQILITPETNANDISSFLNLEQDHRLPEFCQREINIRNRPDIDRIRQELDLT